jgi:hypothetical protein
MKMTKPLEILFAGDPTDKFAAIVNKAVEGYILSPSIFESSHCQETRIPALLLGINKANFKGK